MWICCFFLGRVCQGREIVSMKFPSPKAIAKQGLPAIVLTFSYYVIGRLSLKSFRYSFHLCVVYLYMSTISQISNQSHNCQRRQNVWLPTETLKLNFVFALHDVFVCVRFRFYHQLQECIPVRCVLTAAVATTRCHYQGVSMRQTPSRQIPLVSRPPPPPSRQK